MFNSNSDTLLRKRDGILGQFNKAVLGLIQVNEEIDSAAELCAAKVKTLEDKAAQELEERNTLLAQKTDNLKTIGKLKEFLV